MTYVCNLGQAFEEVVRQGPHSIALWYGRSAFGQVSYDSLNRRANQLARWLLDEGVEKNDVVAIVGRKGAEVYASLLACLKIGAIYVVYDPDSPQARLDKIFQTCCPYTYFPISAWDDNLGYSDDNVPGQNVTGADPAYIMYTSGSTGVPKGAVMTHANVLNFVAWSGEAYDITRDEVLTGLNPLYFDNSVFDLYASLFHGATLVPMLKDEVTDPKRLAERIDLAQCTIWFSVPSLLIYMDTMKALDGKNFEGIEKFIFGGEGYPKAHLKKLQDAYPAARLFNVYGPTECTCICSSYEIKPTDFKSLQGYPPLGRLAGNFDYLILDEDGRESIAGELCLLGPQVGLGYYHAQTQTERSFVQHPFNTRYREIMYKTGDQVYIEDGKLHISGRTDQQIKHMGHRIELGEIETALCQLDNVAEAVVLYGPVGGLDMLVAIVGLKGAGSQTSIAHELAGLLPSYMIPSQFHFVEGLLPRNANGKLDRVRLWETYLSIAFQSDAQEDGCENF